MRPKRHDRRYDGEPDPPRGRRGPSGCISHDWEYERLAYEHERAEGNDEHDTEERDRKA